MTVSWAGDDGIISIGESGTVLTSAITAINIFGENNSFSNAGRVSGDRGVFVTGNNTELLNAGTIEGLGSDFGTAVSLRGSGQVVRNTGTLNGTNVAIGDDGTLSAADIFNSGIMSGGTFGISLTSGDNHTIFNSRSGVISSDVQSVFLAGDNAEVSNYGILEGDVVLPGANPNLTNGGEIFGSIIFGAQDATYQGRLDGWVSDTVLGGIGDDTFVGGTRTDRLTR